MPVRNVPAGTKDPFAALDLRLRTVLRDGRLTDGGVSASGGLEWGSTDPGVIDDEPPPIDNPIYPPGWWDVPPDWGIGDDDPGGDGDGEGGGEDSGVDPFDPCSEEFYDPDLCGAIVDGDDFDCARACIAATGGPPEDCAFLCQNAGVPEEEEDDAATDFYDPGGDDDPCDDVFRGMEC